MEHNDELQSGFMIFNATDGVFFDPRTFETKEEASDAAEKHRAAYARQGYYLTADSLRIAPEDLELEIVPAED